MKKTKFQFCQNRLRLMLKRKCKRFTLLRNTKYLQIFLFYSHSRQSILRVHELAHTQHVSTDPHPKVKEYSISGNLLKLNFDEMVNKRSLPINRIVEDIPSKLACLDIICKLNWKISPSLEFHFV